jgi:hypothetical protein
MTGKWTVEDMYALGKRHADLEARGDLEATMNTLVADPVYELLPLGLQMRGADRVRRYYEHLLGPFVSMTVGYLLLDEWVNENSVCQEYEIELDVNGERERHRVVGILYRSGHLLGGERVYASERCLRLMAGDDLIDELHPVGPARPPKIDREAH